MLDGVDPNLTPSVQTVLVNLLWAIGAWESLKEMGSIMATQAHSLQTCSAAAPLPVALPNPRCAALA
jgi:hypothetical protein